jgi:hypothetical protein
MVPIYPKALEVHYFPIRLTLRRNVEIKHMFKQSATAKPYVSLTGYVEFNEF